MVGGGNSGSAVATCSGKTRPENGMDLYSLFVCREVYEMLVDAWTFFL